MTDKTPKLPDNIAPVERKAFSIVEFCQAHGIGRRTYFDMRKVGLTPAEIRVGRRVLITEESATAWRLKMAQQEAAA